MNHGSEFEHLSQFAVFGPLLVFSGLGQKPPQWVRLGMVLVGGATILYNLNMWLKARQAPVLEEQMGQMRHGPFERAGELYRPTLLRRRRYYRGVAR